METRLFGKTGYDATIITLGGCGLGNLSQEEADKAIKLAVDAGINIIDVAPSYGDAEIRLQPLLKHARNNFFLAEKTLERTKVGAQKELYQSLERLGVKNIDLYQFHAVGTMEELEKIFAKEGAIKAFQEAKDAGIIKYIGLTGHADIRVHKKALDLFDFDTLLLPVGIGSLKYPHPSNDFYEVLKMAKDRNIGIVSIKAIEKRRWVSEKDHPYTTWYEPFYTQDIVNKTVWFTLSQEYVTTYSLPCDTKLWPLVINAGKSYHKLGPQEIQEVLDLANEYKILPLFPS